MTPAKPPSTTAKAFKDNIDTELVNRLAVAFSRVDGDLDVEGFRVRAVRGLEELELKARVAHVAEALVTLLPAGFEAAAGVVGDLVQGDGEGAPIGDQLIGWDMWPVVAWVPLVGRDHPATALDLLRRLTSRASAEFAIRPFIDDDPQAVREVLRDWVGDEDEHVRRLVSEGTRPKLPWAPKLRISESDPAYAVELLDGLVDDPSDYVRRSVANHLNDLCRVDPDLALQLAESWARIARESESVGDDAKAARLQRVVAHGLRTLVKSGEPAAMDIVGFDPDLPVDAALQMHTPVVRFGSAAEWTLVLRNETTETQRVLVDYAIRHVRADGSRGRKVFKWKVTTLPPDGTVELSRRHPIVAITTRTYYPGTHPVEVQVNGRVVAGASFELRM